MSLSVRDSATGSAGGAMVNQPAGVSESRCAFSLIELIVVIAIISLLAGLILAALAAGKAEAQLLGCRGNLRQIGLALAMYVGDFGAYPVFAEFPERDLFWHDQLNAYLAQPLG
ncbi:MAG: DUF1559 domain-containing protein, partial [Verrucomicrobiales bacterium]|nr:DUF1559 domain-containing protein [Verrucomicrobiales bacterium]